MKIKNITYTLLCIITLTFLFLFTVDTFASISTTVTLFTQKVFPSLFLFILFTNILLNSNAIYMVSSTLGFIPKILGLSKNASIPILLGFLCGFPSASSAIDKLYDDRALSKKECNFLMAFCNNASPTFIISTIGYVMLSSKHTGILLLIIHIISSIIIAFIYAVYYNKNIIHENNVNLKGLCKNDNSFYKKVEILKSLPISIYNTFKSMVYILAYMIIFNIFSDILNGFNIPNINYLTSTFELTKGITYFAKLNNLPYIAFLLGFSSFSIIFQIKSSLKYLDYPIYKIIFFKFLHGVISLIIAYLIF